MTGVDVLVLSLGTTEGWRHADRAMARMLEQAGATVAFSGVRIGAAGLLRRGYPVNDFVEALAARRALGTAIQRHRPRAVLFCSTTPALLAGDPGVPYAVWLDSPARLNRPGPLNAPLHWLERRQLARARVLLPHSPGTVAALPADSAWSVMIPPPIEEAPPPSDARERIAVGYPPDPKAKGLALLCAAWERAALPGVRLLIAGIPPERAHAFLARSGAGLPPGAELVGMLPQPEFRDLLARAHVFVSAAAWEDFGIAPLEALDRGAVLVSAPAGGPFPALALARRLAPEFVAAERTPESLAGALEAAFAAPDDRLAAYRKAARAELAAYRPETSVARLRDDVLPALLGE